MRRRAAANWSALYADGFSSCWNSTLIAPRTSASFAGFVSLAYAMYSEPIALAACSARLLGRTLGGAGDIPRVVRCARHHGQCDSRVVLHRRKPLGDLLRQWSG